jgi:hypothetical protein
MEGFVKNFTHNGEEYCLVYKPLDEGFDTVVLKKWKNSLKQENIKIKDFHYPNFIEDIENGHLSFDDILNDVKSYFKKDIRSSKNMEKFLNKLRKFNSLI